MKIQVQSSKVFNIVPYILKNRYDFLLIFLRPLYQRIVFNVRTERSRKELTQGIVLATLILLYVLFIYLETQ